MEKFKIILDAGHGKDTPGKRVPDGSMREFQFNAAVATLAKNLLVKFQNVEVQFTHDPSGEIDVPLEKRSNYCNQWGANVLVSIHANADGDGWSDGNGIETFTYTTKPKEAMELAAILQKRMVGLTGRRDRGVKQANLHMVREVKCTAVLVECGFMTNHTEAELLKSQNYRLLCAQAIANSLVEKYKLKPIPQAEPPKPAGTAYRVQVGYFTTRENAEAMKKQLAEKGFVGIITEA